MQDRIYQSQDMTVELNSLESVGDEEQAIVFSIPFDLEEEDSIWAVDWDWHGSGSWEVSRRDYGVGHAWESWGPIVKMDVKHNTHNLKISSQALLGLLRSFGISLSDTLTPDKIFRMSPRELARLGTKDPESYTLSDHRRASEVR